MRQCLPGEIPGQIGVALSGGSDSTALLVLLHDWAAARNVALAAATVDHGLRPDSASEARLAARTCARLGIPHQTLHWRGWQGQGNLQAAARAARFALLADWAKGANLSAIALGHTLDDQAETVLMRLMRGSGVDGLSGMAMRNAMAGAIWLRPLLGLRREDMREMLRARGFGWCDDPTNDDPAYDRVRLRQAMAALGLDPEGLSATATRLQSARQVLELTAEQAARRLAKVDPAGDVILQAEGFRALPAETALRLLGHSLAWVASAPYRPRHAALARLHDQLLEGQRGALAGCLVRPDRGTIRISREPAAVAEMVVPVGEIWDGRWRVRGPDQPPGASIATLGEAGLAQCPDWRETGLMRGSLIASPAVWRDGALITAPLAGRANGWTAHLDRGAEHYFSSILSH
ncbi:MAG: tRNA lysidine(34) synthetase TilS [Rhodobacteraceae bacterium]|nr:tRNA lysidine(34) synthetase TilS [Paracoccaceae bacterium]